MNTLKHYAERDGVSYDTAKRRRKILNLGELINPNNPRGGYRVKEKEWEKIKSTCEIRGWRPGGKSNE